MKPGLLWCVLAIGYGASWTPVLGVLPVFLHYTLFVLYLTFSENVQEIVLGYNNICLCGLAGYKKKYYQ